jgi:hypothetical protein
MPLNDVNYNVTVGQSTFSMALCFTDSSGKMKNMSSIFGNYSTIEFVQYNRHGNQPYTQLNTSLNPMGDPLKYFKDDSNLLTSDYGNCYAIALGSNVFI